MNNKINNLANDYLAKKYQSIPIVNNINLLSDDFKNFATEIAIGDKFAALTQRLPKYQKFEELTYSIYTRLSQIKNFWQVLKVDFHHVLNSIYQFIIRYQTSFKELEKNLLYGNDVNIATEKSLSFIYEILVSAGETRKKIDNLKRDIISFVSFVQIRYQAIQSNLLPQIQKEIQKASINTKFKQERLESVRQRIDAGERELTNHAIGIGTGALAIALGIGTLLLSGFGGLIIIGGIVGIATSGVISANIENELKSLKIEQKKLLEEIKNLNFDVLYLKDLETNFEEIIQQMSIVRNIFQTLATSWLSVNNSLEEVQYKLNNLSEKVQHEKLRYIKGSLTDINQAFHFMLEKIKRYDMLINLPISEDETLIKPNGKILLNSSTPLLIPNHIYFQYQPDYLNKL